MPTAIAELPSSSSHIGLPETSSHPDRKDDSGGPDTLPRRRWNRAEYHAMGEANIFGLWERVELIEGEIVAVSPKSVSHTTAIKRTLKRLVPLFENLGHTIRKEEPVVLDDLSEPEPDIVVARGSDVIYETHHPGPDELLLVVEVSLTTIRGDRAQKGRMYARAGVPEYWLVNLPERRIEVYRDPGMIGAESGYRSVTLVTEDQNVSPTDAPDANIPVRDLLP